MSALIALIPIILVLVLMLAFRWGSAQAGAAGWACSIVVGLLAFGLNWDVFWVSQGKGLLLTLNVVLLLVPGIFLYSMVDELGGIRAISRALESLVHDTGWLLILQAWMLSALLECLAGFGLPVAITAPLLIALGVPAVPAVAAAAVGHSWASSTSGMALPLRMIADITHYPPEQLFPSVALMVGVACFLSGLGAAFILKQKGYWWRILLTSIVVGGIHYVAGQLGALSVAELLATTIGFFFGALLVRRPKAQRPEKSLETDPALRSGTLAYGLLVVIILIVSLWPALNQQLSKLAWTLSFPSVTTRTGFSTVAENGYVFHFLTHPGTLIIVTILLAVLIFHFSPRFPAPDLKKTLRRTLHSAGPALTGTLFMIGLSTIMEHTGMTQALANELGALAGKFYPLFSPLIGVIGSFATGSNVNSNVLFGTLQKGVALLVGASPIVILAAQTVGGGMGSMIAPAKLAVGTSTSAAKGSEGKVLRLTLPISIAVAVVLGVLAFILS